MSNSTLPNCNIRPMGKISEAFVVLGIHSFQEACLYIKNLPYRRNLNKEDLLCVFKEQCGTCSTKHAVLKLLADEIGLDDVQLYCGIYKMSAHNTPAVASYLKLHGLAYIPEAHNYLKYKNQILDCTFADVNTVNFVDDLIEEIEIRPSQISDYKVKYHRDFLSKWIENNVEIHLSLDELWTIREQCIRDIASN